MAETTYPDQPDVQMAITTFPPLSEAVHAAAKTRRLEINQLMTKEIPDPALQSKITEIAFTLATTESCADLCAAQYGYGTLKYAQCVDDTCDQLQARIAKETPTWPNEGPFWVGVEAAAKNFVNTTAPLVQKDTSDEAVITKFPPLSEAVHAAAKTLRLEINRLMTKEIPDPALQSKITEIAFTLATTESCADLCAAQYGYGTLKYAQCVDDTCDQLQARIAQETPTWPNEGSFWVGVETAAKNFVTLMAPVS